MQIQATNLAGLPAPQNDDQRKLLQVVWEEAFGDTGWPTFALVDRRLDQQGVDAVQVLARIPAHLLVAWPDASRIVPQPETRLELTIAGAAHCSDSADTVHTFVALVQAMAAVEAHWPVDDTTRPTLLSSDAVNKLGLPATPASKELLRRAFLLSQQEHWAQGTNSGPEAAHGQLGWELSVDRKVRAYRGVEDIGDYWKRRSAALAPTGGWRPTPEPIPEKQLFTPNHVRGPVLDGLVASLVLWLYELTEGNTEEMRSPADFAQDHQLSPGRIGTLLQYAEQAGVVHRIRTLGNDRGTQIALSVSGVAKAERLLRLRGTHWVRFDYLASALVVATMDTYPKCRLEVQDFLVSPAAMLYGQALELDEILLAVEYLGEKGLAVLNYGRGGPPQALTLTALGKECGTADDVNVRDFMRNQPGFNIGTVNNYGGGNQFGSGNVQTNAFGPNSGELAEFAMKVLEAARSADLPDGQRIHLVQDAQALVDEANASAPDPGRLRQLWQRVSEPLVQSAGDATVQALMGAAQNFF
ncbi:hypothetical protein [Streptomyces sp. NPDC088261]|uniref:hypothetical protein n=1 Tax=Streptomyces sp. NPDC088261 TaxID=3365851 RepID=UPI0038151F29